MNAPRPGTIRAFTLVELIVVMGIIILLAGVAAPAFSQFAKGTKVQQAVAAVETALYHARSEAQNLRAHTAVYYGDDLDRLGLASTPNPVPKPGSIEVWAVRGTSGYGAFAGYAGTGPVMIPAVTWPDEWYPFRFQTKLITKQPITIPEGIRIFAGNFVRAYNGGSYDCIFEFPKYRRDAIGEIKRHHTVFAQRGGLVRNDLRYAWNYILIFDESSGDHAVLEAGRCQSATRPKVLPYRVTHIGGTKLSSYKEIGPLIDKYPGNQ
jgi:type II secretory pathway pseudopilin PulG